MASSINLVADQLRRVEVRSPSELIVEQLRDLIMQGVLKPGQKLPSERIMAERFGVSRGIVREALRRMEFYGVVRTLPQSGTVLENLGATTLVFLMDNLLEMPGNDFGTLAEARLMVEPRAAALAARNADQEADRRDPAGSRPHRPCQQVGPAGAGGQHAAAPADRGGFGQRGDPLVRQPDRAGDDAPVHPVRRLSGQPPRRR